MGCLAEVIKTLQQEYPRICVHIFSGDADAVTERIGRGLLGFGLLIEPANTSRYESLLLSATGTRGVLMRRDSPLAEQESICLEDLWELPLIPANQRLVDDRLSKWIRRDVKKLYIVAMYILLSNATSLVEKRHRLRLGY